MPRKKKITAEAVSFRMSSAKNRPKQAIVKRFHLLLVALPVCPVTMFLRRRGASVVGAANPTIPLEHR